MGNTEESEHIGTHNLAGFFPRVNFKWKVKKNFFLKIKTRLSNFSIYSLGERRMIMPHEGLCNLIIHVLRVE